MNLGEVLPRNPRRVFGLCPAFFLLGPPNFVFILINGTGGYILALELCDPALAGAHLFNKHVFVDNFIIIHVHFAWRADDVYPLVESPIVQNLSDLAYFGTRKMVVAG